MTLIREAISRIKSGEGATAVEYAIMVALIAAVIIVAVTTIGRNANSAFECVGDALPAGSTATAGC